MEENKNNEERKLVSDLGMPVDPKQDFSMPSTSAKPNFSSDSGTTTSFKPKAAETRKQNKAISGLGEGQTATTGKLAEKPAEKPAEESFTPEENKLMQKNVDYNNFRRRLLPAIQKRLEAEGKSWDKRAIANAEKTIADEFKKQNIQREKSAFETKTQQNEEARLAHEKELYDKSLAILNNPDADKDSAEYFNAQRIVDEHSRSQEIEKLMSENPDMTRKTAEDYLEQKSQKEAEARKQAEEEQKFQDNLEIERKASEGLKKTFQDVINSNPEGPLKEWATDELDRMNQMDTIKANLRSNGIPENSPVFQRYARAEMKIYDKMKALSKMQDRAAAKKAIALEKEKQNKRKLILSMAAGISAPWVKLIASVIAMSAFGIIK